MNESNIHYPIKKKARNELGTFIVEFLDITTVRYLYSSIDKSLEGTIQNGMIPHTDSIWQDVELKVA